MHEDHRGNYFYITTVIARSGQKHKISSTSHVNKLVEKGDINADVGKSLIFKKSVFLVSDTGELMAY